MSNIPTSKIFIEFLEKKGTIFPNEKEKLRAQNSFLEFAKLHVEEALKKASEIAESAAKQYLRVSDDEDFNKELVLNAYPLTNIK